MSGNVELSPWPFSICGPEPYVNAMDLCLVEANPETENIIPSIVSRVNRQFRKPSPFPLGAAPAQA